MTDCQAKSEGLAAVWRAIRYKCLPVPCRKTDGTTTVILVLAEHLDIQMLCSIVRGHFNIQYTNDELRLANHHLRRLSIAEALAGE